MYIVALYIDSSGIMHMLVNVTRSPRMTRQCATSDGTNSAVEHKKAMFKAISSVQTVYITSKLKILQIIMWNIGMA